MAYFTYFPHKFYDLDGSGNITFQKVTDITKRLRFLQNLQIETSLYYQYVIKDTDTPENIADRYYGNPHYFWVILLFNNIMDPQFDWPMTDNQLNDYIINKYGIANINAVHHYELHIDKTDINTQMTTEWVYVIDYNTYYSTPQSTVESLITQTGNPVTITTTTAIVTNYTYEQTINESKRQINIIKKEYLGQIEGNLEQEFK